MRFAFTILFALGSTPSATAADPFVSKEGRYSVQFPGKPKEEKQSLKTAAGELKMHTATFSQPDGTTFAVIYTDFPAAALNGVTPESILTGAREGIRGKEGRLLTDKEEPFGPDKLPSREVLVDKGATTLRVRVLMRNTRLYQVMVGGGKAVVTGPSGDDFMASFELAK